MSIEKGSYNVYIGDVALDEYYKAERWPGTADKENVETLPAVPGGMIANAACVSAALGKKTLFITVMNDGAISRFLLEDLEKSGVDTSFSITDNSLPDSKTMIFLVGSEHTIFIPELKIERIEIDENLLGLLKNAGYIYSTCATLSLIHMGDRGWNSIAEECRAAGAKVAVDYDVDYERNGDDGRFINVDTGFFNETGFDSVRENRTYEEEAAHLMALGMKTVVVTLADKGCIIYTETDTYKVPARNVKVVDVTGAGDTFCSSFVTVSDKMGIEDAAKFATAAASICISSLGARSGAVPLQRVLDVLNS